MIDCFRYYNFVFISNDDIKEESFHYSFKYDYYILVFNLLSTYYIDINEIIILKYLFLKFLIEDIHTIQNYIFQ